MSRETENTVLLLVGISMVIITASGVFTGMSNPDCGRGW